MRELQADGILEQVRRGIQVIEVKRKDLENIYRIRASLEAMVVQQFITGASDAAVQALSETVNTIEAAYQAGDLVRQGHQVVRVCRNVS